MSYPRQTLKEDMREEDAEGNAGPKAREMVEVSSASEAEVVIVGGNPRLDMMPILWQHAGLNAEVLGRHVTLIPKGSPRSLLITKLALVSGIQSDRLQVHRDSGFQLSLVINRTFHILLTEALS